MDLRAKVIEIKYRMAFNGLSYDEAKKELQPYLDEANKKGFKIAKKYNKKFNKLTFSYVTR
jgi:hypothetical protein